MSRKIAIAPMMAYTDRHFRFLMRLITKQTWLYTEMVSTASIIHSKEKKFLEFSSCEHPLALQLGGSCPKDLGICARIAEDLAYDEINFNVGCPSTRAHAGEFGACLIKKPGIVAEAVAAMKNAVKIPVTVKTRTGVDDQDSYEELHQFVELVNKAGCETFIIHARKAWLRGLNPHQNRSIPPLHYDKVYQLKHDFPHLEIIINGGVKTLDEIQRHLQFVDGVMIGREAYTNPYLMASVDKFFFQQALPEKNRQDILNGYLPYIAHQYLSGTPVYKLFCHLMGLFHGQRGAKHWRLLLNEYGRKINNVESIFNLMQKLGQEFP